MELKLVRDKTKKDTYMCYTLLNMFKRGELRKDHPLQRKSGRWANDARDGFVATAIKHEDVDSIKICEQIKNDTVTLWLIDGIQRLTTLENYRNGVFKLGNKVEDPIIYYQIVKIDENEEPVKDDDGNVKYEVKEFDLRGKAYKDLPVQLKEYFDNFPIDVVKHLDCSNKKVGYHIRRYNRQATMNTTETGVTYMDDAASYVKEIADTNRFFKDFGCYKETEKQKSTIYRIVAESVMAMFYLDDWKKQTKQMGAYISNHATEDNFDTLNKNLNRLQNIVIDKCKDLFNSKNSFVWFTLFERFKAYDLSDDKFGDFLNAFVDELHMKRLPEYDDMSFDDIDISKSTKDKTVVMKKINFLETLMKKYLDIKESWKINEYSVDSLMHECFGSEFSEEDIDQFEEVLDDLTLNVDNTSKLLDEKNRPSLIAIVAYSFRNDIDLDDWIVDYFTNNKLYFNDQMKNYLHMKKDLETYLQLQTKQAV